MAIDGNKGRAMTITFVCVKRRPKGPGIRRVWQLNW